MSDDLLITPGSRKLEIKDHSGNVDAKIETDASGNLLITNAGGDISIGDTSSDVFIGDGTNNVDIVFEQDGEIRGTSGVTLTLGASGSNVRLATDLNLNSNDITNVGDLTVNNLTVSGTTTTVNSTNTTISDSLIELNSGLTGANSKDIGLIFERGSTGNNAAFFWDESGDRFRFVTTTNTGAANTIDSNVAEGTVQAGSFIGNGSQLSSLNASNLSSGTIPSARFPDNIFDSYRRDTIDSSSEDFNNYLTTGTYAVNNWSDTNDTVANGPTNSAAGAAYGWGLLRVTNWQSTTGSSSGTGTYVLQEYWPHNEDIVYSRIMWNGSFTNWRAAWGNENDGSGSGLDADKLDGQHGTYYRSASNLNAGTVPSARLHAGVPFGVSTSSGNGTENTFTTDGGQGSNNLTRSTFFRDNSGQFGALGLSITHPSNTNYTMQIATTSYSDPDTLQVRVKNNGTWTSAIDILTESSTINTSQLTGSYPDSTKLPLAGGTMTGAINAGGGINGLTLSNGISGNNFNITGVNQLSINDPGEGIVFGGGSNTVSLYAVDDTADNIMKFDGASELLIGNNVALMRAEASVSTNSTATSSTDFVTVFNVNGSNLGSCVLVTGHGTTGNVVVNFKAEILVNHSGDIFISSISGNYTQMDIKVTSNSNEDFAIEFKRTDTQTSTAGIKYTCTPLDRESIVTTVSSHSYTGTTLTHRTKAGSFQSATDGADHAYFNNMRVGHNIYHDGDTDTKIVFDTNRIRLYAGGAVKLDTNNTYLTSGDGNNYLTGLSFNTSNGIITATRTGLSDITVDLDGRYLTSYTESDTLDSVCDRGSTTNQGITAGNFETTAHVTAGKTSGGVSLTHNDGYGNANVTFNHKSGVPEQNGNSGRIVVNTDTSGSAQMNFELQSSVSSGVAINTPSAMELEETALDIPNSLRHMGDTDTYLQFLTDRTRMYAGNVKYLDIRNSDSSIYLASDTFQFTTSGAMRQINGNVGIPTTYGLYTMEGTDAQMDLVSSSAGTWGSALNFVEGASTSANTNVWSIARKTTGGDGDGSLNFNFGTSNQHDNTMQARLTNAGALSISGQSGQNLTMTGTMFRHNSGSGYVEIGPSNTSWGHIQTDRASFYFNKKLTVDEGIVQSYNEDLHLRRAQSSAGEIEITTNAIFLKNKTIVVQAESDQNTNADTTAIPGYDVNAAVMEFQGAYTNGQYTTQFSKVDRSGNLPLYVRQSKGTANTYENVARFGDHGQGEGTSKFAVFGDMQVKDGNIKLYGNLDLTEENNTGTNSIHLPRGGMISFYGNSNDDHAITSKNMAQSATDDLRISSYGSVFVNLDANSNNTSGADFIVNRHNATSGSLLKVNGETGALAITPDGSNNAGVYLENYTSGTVPISCGRVRIESNGKTGWGSGDELGSLDFYNNDGSGIGARTHARIVAVNNQGNGSTTTTFESELEFYTSSHNTALNSEPTMRMKHNGEVHMFGPNATLKVGDGSSTAQKIEINKADGNSDHITFKHAGTTTGEIGSTDTSWLRINQQTNKNIYTPRYIRADGGFYVDGTTFGINGSGKLLAASIPDNSLVSTTNSTTMHQVGLNEVSGSASSYIEFRKQTNYGEPGQIYFYTSAAQTTSRALNFRMNHKDFHADGDIIAYSAQTTSDIRLKENIRSLDSCLDKTLNLKGVKFDWKEESKGKDQLGFIAQEIEEVLPEVVTEVESIGENVGEIHKVVNYQAVVPVLVEAIKEQQSIINRLEERLKDLENKIGE